MDYSKWEQLSKQQEEEEEREKIIKREQRKQKYLNEQAEKKREYEAKHPGEDHVHKPSCGCGFADPEQLKQMQQQKKDELPLEERNKKKMIAVEATREHGKELFGEGKYEHAYAVFDRGVLIINGCYGFSPEEEDKLTQHEYLLNLNMALCKLKLEDWTKAIDHCRMAMQIEKESVKAHFRTGQAYMGLGEYDAAKEWFLKTRALDPENKAVSAQLERIKQLKAAEAAKQRKFNKQMAARLAAQS